MSKLCLPSLDVCHMTDMMFMTSHVTGDHNRLLFDTGLELQSPLGNSYSLLCKIRQKCIVRHSVL